MTTIELTIKDDGTFEVETEEAQAEQQEAPETPGTGQQFKTLAEALKAISQMAQQASMAPPEQGPGDDTGADQGGQEEQAMMDNFQPGSTGRM